MPSCPQDSKERCRFIGRSAGDPEKHNADGRHHRRRVTVWKMDSSAGPEPVSRPSGPPLQQAFNRVMAKARWGVTGALIGAVLLSGLEYFGSSMSASPLQSPNRPLYMACAGSVAGAFGGAALGGGGFGPIGLSMVTCLFTGLCCCPGIGAIGNQDNLVLMLATCIAAGFMIGTVIEFTRAWRHKPPGGPPGNAPPVPPDSPPPPRLTP